jgi:hypothetical protein
MLTLPLPLAYLCHIINPLSLPFTIIHLFISHMARYVEPLKVSTLASIYIGKSWLLSREINNGAVRTLTRLDMEGHCNLWEDATVGSKESSSTKKCLCTRATDHHQGQRRGERAQQRWTWMKIGPHIPPLYQRNSEKRVKETLTGCNLSRN